MNGGRMMVTPSVTIEYKTADRSRIQVEVSPPVKRLLEQSDRQIRSQRRQDRRHVSYVDFMDGLADTAMIDPRDSITDLVVNMESYERLYAALAQLSAIQRRRICLYYGYDLTHRQIAALEGVDHSAIGKAIRRAVTQLQRRITE